MPSSALPNPLREGLVEERIPEPATMVIFGASGDLARRKLLPALYSLTRDRLLPARFAVLGFGRHAQDDDAFREEMRRGCDEFARRRPVDAPLWARIARQTEVDRSRHRARPANHGDAFGGVARGEHGHARHGGRARS